jgi:hypothetical protein
LHQANLADSPDSIRIICAFDQRDGISYFRRKTALLGLLSDKSHMCQTTNWMRLGQADQALNGVRERQGREVGERLRADADGRKQARDKRQTPTQLPRRTLLH